MPKRLIIVATLAALLVLSGCACSRDAESANSSNQVTTMQADNVVDRTATMIEQEDAFEKPAIDIESWQYILANHWNEIGDYEPNLTYIESDESFDARAADDLRAFIKAARNEGLSVYLSSAYRSYSTQKYLYNRKVSQVGEEKAWTIVSVPGTSEHQTGLAADITDQYYEVKSSSLENTKLYQWMSAHCHEYGFIVRYPKDKQDITGVIYEPWHFRYVGQEAATYMVEHNLCLEEFVALYKDINTA